MTPSSRPRTSQPRTLGAPTRLAEPLERRLLLSDGTALSNPALWQVAGRSRADEIIIEQAPGDAGMLRASVNGAVVGTRPVAGLRRIEVVGGPGNDTVTLRLSGDAARVPVRVDAGRGRDLVYGGDGDDQILGGPGADELHGGAGNDRLDGGPGNDDLSGGTGADFIIGGPGRDVVRRQGGVDTTTFDARDRFGGDDNANTLTRLLSDDATRQWLIEAAVRQYKWAFGQPAWGWRWLAGADGSVFATAAPPVLTPDANASPTTSVGDNFSRTNTQEQGVDEADLVETDGQFIYTLRSAPPPPFMANVYPPQPIKLQSDLFIADAVPAEQMHVASHTTVEGTPLGMYLVGERLAVVSQSYPAYPMIDWIGVAAPEVGRVQFVAPGGGGVIDPGHPKVKVTVFDVADRAAPRVVEETTLNGSYDSSRAIADRLYLVMRNDTWVPAPLIVDGAAGDGTGTGTGSDTSRVYQSEDSYRARLQATPLAELFPAYDAKAGAAESKGALVSAPDLYVKETDAPVFGQNMLSVSVLDVGDNAAGPTDTTTVAGWAGVTYASPRALYLAGMFFDGGTDARTDPPRSGTNLFKFALEPDSVPLAATGEVSGRVLNQFSMDEEGSDFRIATTTAQTFDPAGGTGTPASSGVYVLRQDGEDLKLVGGVTGLGLTEQIRSARFVGDTAYLVTFRQVDPLFVIDLRDPVHPKVAGELKVPGFSSYLHPVGEGLLLGIGRDADATGRVNGLQLSLLDVSDPAHPKQIMTYKPGDGYAFSDAESNHLAFSWFPESGILAIPVVSFSPAAVDPTITPRVPLYSLEVFRVDSGYGIVPIGKVTAENAVLRSLRIGTVLYAISNDQILAAQLESPGTVIATLPLPPSNE